MLSDDHPKCSDFEILEWINPFPTGVADVFRTGLTLQGTHSCVPCAAYTAGLFFMIHAAENTATANSVAGNAHQTPFNPAAADSRNVIGMMTAKPRSAEII